MPFYDYLCERCGTFSALVPMAHASSPRACPGCATLAPRIVSAPQLNLMSSSRRRIDARNEKSAHVPETVHRPSHAEGGACAHHGGHAGDGGHSHAHPKGHSHAPARPWMIGH
jgi:putative FmdB family regulatory protein